MQGRRIPVPEGESTQALMQAINQALTHPGDYCGPLNRAGVYDGRPMVWFILPDFDTSHLNEMQRQAVKGLRLVTSPPHAFTEEPDGSLTIRESILAYGWQEDDGSVPQLWHGYLTAGIWTQVK